MLRETLAKLQHRGEFYNCKRKGKSVKIKFFKMKKNKSKNKSIEIFSKEELDEFELLEIRGGRVGEIMAVDEPIGNHCTVNEVAGCGCSVILPLPIPI